jgi:hypothetical protein
MKRKLTIMLALIFSISNGAYAASKGHATASRDDQVSRSEAPSGMEAKTMYTQRVSLGPELGVINYTDNTGQKSARGSLGLNAEWNVANFAKLDIPRELYVGLQSGVQVAKVGPGDANFFGGGSNTATALDNATMAIAPVNAKVGYNISEKARVSAHGGANIIYRSSAGAVRLANDDPASTETAWNVYPNVGADFEFKVGDNLGIMARPDVTLAPDESVFVGTLAANVMF